MATDIWTGATDGDWGTSTNWSNATVPGTGDTAVIPADATVNIDGSDETATPIDILIIEKGCSITIGSSATDLHLSFASETNAKASLSGSGVTFLKVTEAKAVEVYDAAAAPGTGQYGLNLTSATTTNNTTLDIMCEDGDSIGIAANADETAEFQYIYIAGGDVTVGANVTESDGATAPDLTMDEGTVEIKCAIGSLKQTNGTLTKSAGNAATVYAWGGTTYWDNGNITTYLYVGSSGTVDFSRTLLARTIQVASIYAGGSYLDPHAKASRTSSLTCQHCRLTDVTIDIGVGAAIV